MYVIHLSFVLLLVLTNINAQDHEALIGSFKIHELERQQILGAVNTKRKLRSITPVFWSSDLECQIWQTVKFCTAIDVTGIKESLPLLTRVTKVENYIEEAMIAWVIEEEKNYVNNTCLDVSKSCNNFQALMNPLAHSIGCQAAECQHYMDPLGEQIMEKTKLIKCVMDVKPVSVRDPVVVKTVGNGVAVVNCSLLTDIENDILSMVAPATGVTPAPKETTCLASDAWMEHLYSQTLKTYQHVPMCAEPRDESIHEELSKLCADIRNICLKVELAENCTIGDYKICYCANDHYEKLMIACHSNRLKPVYVKSLIVIVNLVVVIFNK